MSRWERWKLSITGAVIAFFIQVFLRTFPIQFVDQATGQFRLGAEFRFKFVDETTRQFVLVSELQKLPSELRTVAVASALLAFACYGGLSLYLQIRGKPARESSPAPQARE